jgi:hypothetical protein
MSRLFSSRGMRHALPQPEDKLPKAHHYRQIYINFTPLKLNVFSTFIPLASASNAAPSHLALRRSSRRQRRETFSLPPANHSMFIEDPNRMLTSRGGWVVAEASRAVVQYSRYGSPANRPQVWSRWSLLARRPQSHTVALNAYRAHHMIRRGNGTLQCRRALRRPGADNTHHANTETASSVSDLHDLPRGTASESTATLSSFVRCVARGRICVAVVEAPLKGPASRLAFGHPFRAHCR